MSVANMTFGTSDYEATGLDEGLARRLKALACTAPLHDLDARKSRLDWADASSYQMAEIAFQTIDQVTLAMDFDRGANQEEVVSRVVPFIAAQVPGRGQDEYRRVARWVLENLINVGSTDRGFRQVYGVVGESGGYERRTFQFKLLIELVDDVGGVYLRASDEAINVLVGALDTDVESAQIALEIKLENLIKRGRLSDAQVAAQQARIRTVQYTETLRRKLEATRRDVRAVDWESEVPELITDAIAHVTARCTAESAIRESISTALYETEDPDRRRKAAALVVIVLDCLRRHMGLQTRLMGAHSVFRAEQDRQQFSGAPQRAAVDLFGQLLMPVLELSIQVAEQPLKGFFGGVTGLAIPPCLRLSDLIGMLVSPGQERDDLAGVVPEPDLQPPLDPDVFTEDQWRAATGLLDMLPDMPRRLSDLLGEARTLDPTLPHLVALRVLHAVSPEIGVAHRQNDTSVLVAVDDGVPLLDIDFGGADLLVAIADLVGDNRIPEPAGSDGPYG